MGKRISVRWVAFIQLLSLTLLILSFQACHSQKDFATLLNSQIIGNAMEPTEFTASGPLENGPGFSDGGNGDPYTGKVGSYLHFKPAPAAPCQQPMSTDKVFPHHQIVRTEKGIFLVRQNCVDISPRPLNATDVTFELNGDALLYSGDRYFFASDFTYYLLASPDCPSGTTQNPASPNLFSDSFDWTAPSWNLNSASGLSVDWFGTLEVLPKFRITRTSPRSNFLLQNFGKSPILKINSRYTMSIVLDRGNQTTAYITYSGNKALGDNDQFQIEVNFVQGTSQIILGSSSSNSNSSGVQKVLTHATPYGKGVVVQISFSTPAGANSAQGSYKQPSIGIEPGSPSSGSFIYGTGAYLKEEPLYCLGQAGQTDGSSPTFVPVSEGDAGNGEGF